MPAIKDLLFADLDIELDATRRTLERFPDDKADWRPHAKSRTLQQLAHHVAELPGLATAILTTDSFDVRAPRADRPTPSTSGELLALFEQSASAFRNAAADISDQALTESWSLKAGGHVVMAAPRAVMVRRMGLTHLAHHRAQLGVYYRLLDLPVPGLFGPSADER